MKTMITGFERLIYVVVSHHSANCAITTTLAPSKFFLRFGRLFKSLKKAPVLKRKRIQRLFLERFGKYYLWLNYVLT